MNLYQLLTELNDLYHSLRIGSDFYSMHIFVYMYPLMDTYIALNFTHSKIFFAQIDKKPINDTFISADFKDLNDIHLQL